MTLGKLNKKTLIITTLITILFVTVFFNVAFADLNFTATSPNLLVYDTGRNYHINSVVKTDDGKIIVCHQNTTEHGGQGPLTIHTSSDNGVTWSRTNIITSLLTLSGQICKLNNSKLMIFRMEEYDTNGTGFDIYLLNSTDNGTTWNEGGELNSSRGDCYIKSPPVWHNNKWFLPVDDYGNEESLLYISTDNGDTWTMTKVIQDSLLNKAGAHETSYTCFCILSNGTLASYIHIEATGGAPIEGGKTYLMLSEDDGVTWSSAIDLTTDMNVREEMVQYNYNGGYIMHGRSVIDYVSGSKYYFYIYNSTDGIHWNHSNYTAIDKVTTARTAYSDNYRLNETALFITYSTPYYEDENHAGLNFTILNNFFTPSSTIPPQFISINGDTNGTTIYNSTPIINWTISSSASQYQLQIATDSAFTTLVLNISDINGVNYPLQYAENTTRVSFTIPYADRLTTYNKYYCRVRAYET